MHIRFQGKVENNRHLSIGENKLAILDLLQDHRYLPSNYIGKMLGCEPTTQIVKGKAIYRYRYLSQVLYAMHHLQGLIYVPDKSAKTGRALGNPNVYAYTGDGQEVLEESGRWRDVPKSGNAYEQEFGVSLFTASLRIGTNELPSFSYLTYDDIRQHPKFPQETKDAEVAARKANESPFKIPITYTLKLPDGSRRLVDSLNQRNGKRVPSYKKHDAAPFSIRLERPDLPQGYAAFNCNGVELDLNTEPLGTIEHHICAILELYNTNTYRKRFGFPVGFVIFVVKGTHRMKNIMERLAWLTDGKGHDRILFTTIQDYMGRDGYPRPDGSYLTRDYQRIGYQPLNIVNSLRAVR